MTVRVARWIAPWIACAFVVACGGSAPRPETPEQPAIDERDAERGARGVVKEIYATLGRGNKDGLFALLDDELIVFGPRAADALGTRSDALVALGAELNRREKLPVRSSALEVVPSPGGRSAWAIDVIKVAGASHAVLAILSNTDDLWQVEAATVAALPSRGRVATELARDAIVPPATATKVASRGDAADAIDRFERGLADPAVWGDDLRRRADAVVIGPRAGEVTRGKKAIKKLFKRRAATHTRAARAGAITARTTPDGQLAWVTAPIVRADDDVRALPLRAFAVFERTDDGWTMVALHEAVAVGEPGDGAKYQKLAPPPPPAEEGEPADTARVDKPVKRPKKRTRRSRRHRRRHARDD